ncbi:MAG: ABC-F family ATP-binding cassette domain-containing protein [Nitrospira sp.]|nr:ABC-F family ATP-binding cassette domain-containing protein [Nitrospira sp.]
MSALIYGQKLTKAYGTKRLFHELTLGVSEKDRIGIIGPNGSGKSTLLRIFAGLEQPDEGRVTRRQRLRIAYIPQQADFDSESTVAEEIERAALASGLHAHDCVARVQETLGRMGFALGDQLVGPLSGGWKKRLAIACGFVQAPDVMLVDEPTNHLDLEGMRWLEQVMSQAPWPWVMVSHDRWFLGHATNKVAEINSRYPDGIFLVPGGYEEFLVKREEFLNSQTQQAQALAGKVRREEEWLRRGPKARTTKAKYRVDSAHALQAELAETQMRLRQGETSIDFVGSGRRTKQLMVVHQLQKAFGPRTLIQQLDWVISPGTATGVLGHNGSGKSTLLKLLAKELEPDQGTVTYADKLQVVYFDQNRDHLDPKMTLRRTLSDSGHTVMCRGQIIHLAGWAKRFQFQPEQLDLPIELLSGGEQARAVIARLMLQSADVLIVDEPTNDLDIPTREVLEESLKDFPGALILVTHDRYMMEEVCTDFVGLDGQGGHGQFADYGQWESWLRRQRSGKDQTDNPSKSVRATAERPKAKKLSFRDQQEYDTIEKRVLDAEAVLELCRTETENPKIASNHHKLQEAYENLKSAEQDVERLYTRWAELEAKQQA